MSFIAFLAAQTLLRCSSCTASSLEQTAKEKHIQSCVIWRSPSATCKKVKRKTWNRKYWESGESPSELLWNWKIGTPCALVTGNCEHAWVDTLTSQHDHESYHIGKKINPTFSQLQARAKAAPWCITAVFGQLLLTEFGGTLNFKCSDTEPKHLGNYMKEGELCICKNKYVYIYIYIYLFLYMFIFAIDMFMFSRCSFPCFSDRSSEHGSLGQKHLSLQSLKQRDTQQLTTW